jgi:aconitase A
MERDELRAVQEPLKAEYREDPDRALITLKAEGTLGEGVTCSVNTGRAMADAGLHPASGGDGGQRRFDAISRLDGPIDVEYYLAGGILPAVLRRLAAD